MLVSYNWLKEYVGDALPSVDKVTELLTFHAFEIDGVVEKDGDQVIDVDVLPNRSSDCLCHRGIARELATLLDINLPNDPLAKVPTITETDLISVTVEDAADCPRFTAALIEDIVVTDSPQWLKDRLEAIGQRSINNIVDATNYVMFALGQPLHAYDADKFPQVDGKWQFEVRKAKEGEIVSLLAEGGKEGALGQGDRDVTLSGTELLIVDGSSDTPIGLAGVKGGRFAGVDEKTKRIIVEAAHFDPILTRTTARGLGIVIDASKRFENEPSRELPLYAQHEIAELIATIAEGTFVGMIDEYLEAKNPTQVLVSHERANALLGVTLRIDEMESLLKRAGISVEVSGGLLTCRGPFERTDLLIEEDFIEEIGRIYGYQHVVSEVPKTVPLSELNARHYYSEQIRTTLLELGFSEVITSSFRKKDKVQLRNALATDKSYLRSNLTKNLHDALDLNAGRADLFGNTDTRLFEIGTVFYKDSDGFVTEHVSLAFGVRIKSGGYSGKEDTVVMDTLRTLEETLSLTPEAVTENGVVEINLTELLTTLPAPAEYAPVKDVPDVQYRPFSLYPHMNRDIALWVTAGTTSQEVEAVLNESAGDLRILTTLFDEFTKDGRTSFAFRLVFQSHEKTLTDDAVNKIMDDVYNAAQRQGWEVR